MQRKSAKGQRKKQKARIKKNPDNIETADEKSSVVCFVCNKDNHLLCRWKRKSFSEERSDKIKTP